ncbi:MAG: YkgJ family cysteine cluster protein [Verrucomicrobia bacterium]|nr:YkgJ family cysteine cluster protein [Verrucomicrobiota bacterium]
MNSAEGSFTCQRCGACCRWSGHVLLTEADIARLAAASGLSEEEFIARYTILAANRRQLSLSDTSDGHCVLLENDRCTLYEARPAQCREFPYGWRVAEGCPALDETSAV